jgi:hypothetical protein
VDSELYVGDAANMIEYGELARIVLYRDVRGDRWRYAIYDSIGVWDGWLPDLSAESDLQVVAAALGGFIFEHWKQSIDWPWKADQEGWWSAGPAAI